MIGERSADLDRIAGAGSTRDVAAEPRFERFPLVFSDGLEDGLRGLTQMPNHPRTSVGVGPRFAVVSGMDKPEARSDEEWTALVDLVDDRSAAIVNQSLAASGVPPEHLRCEPFSTGTAQVAQGVWRLKTLRACKSEVFQIVERICERGQ